MAGIYAAQRPGLTHHLGDLIVEGDDLHGDERHRKLMAQDRPEAKLPIRMPTR